MVLQESQLAALMEAHTGRARASWALFVAAAAGNEARPDGDSPSAAAAAGPTDGEALAALREACGLLPQLPLHRQALVRAMSSKAQHHIYHAQWEGASSWLELAVSAGGSGLAQQQTNELLLTQAYVALQQRTGAGAGRRAAHSSSSSGSSGPSPQELSRIVSTVRLSGGDASPLGLHILSRVAVLQGDLPEARRALQALSEAAGEGDFRLVLTACRALASARGWDNEGVTCYSNATKRFHSSACLNELRADLITHLLADGAVNPSVLQLPPQQVEAGGGGGGKAAAHAASSWLPVEDSRVASLLGRMVADHAAGRHIMTGDALATVGALVADNADGAFAVCKFPLALRLCSQHLQLLAQPGAGEQGDAEAEERAQQRARVHRLAALCLLHMHDQSAGGSPATATAAGPLSKEQAAMLTEALGHARASRAAYDSDGAALLVLRIMARLPVKEEGEGDHGQQRGERGAGSSGAADGGGATPASSCGVTPDELSGALEGLCACPGFTPLLLALAVEELLGGLAVPQQATGTGGAGMDVDHGGSSSGGSGGGAIPPGTPRATLLCLQARLRVAVRALQRLLAASDATLASQPQLKHGVLARTLITAQARAAEVEASLAGLGAAAAAGCRADRAVDTLAVLQGALDRVNVVMAAVASAASSAAAAGSPDAGPDAAAGGASTAGLAEVVRVFGGPTEAEWALRAAWNAAAGVQASDDPLATVAAFGLVEGFATLVSKMRRAEEAAATSTLFSAAACAGGSGAHDDAKGAARLRLLTALRRNRCVTGLLRVCALVQAVTHMRLADGKAGLTALQASPRSAALFPRVAAMAPGAHVRDAERCVGAARRCTAQLVHLDKHIAATSASAAEASLTSGGDGTVPPPDGLVRTMDGVHEAMMRRLIALQAPASVSHGGDGPTVSSQLLPLLHVVEFHARVRALCLDAAAASPPAGPDPSRLVSLRADLESFPSKGLSPAQMEACADVVRTPPLASAPLAAVALRLSLDMRLRGSGSSSGVNFPACATVLRKLICLAESRHETLPLLERVKAAVHASLAAAAATAAAASSPSNGQLLAPRGHGADDAMLGLTGSGAPSDPLGALMDAGDDGDDDGSGRAAKRQRTSASSGAPPPPSHRGYPWEELDWAIVTAYNSGVFFYRSRALEPAARFMGWAVAMLPAVEALMGGGSSGSTGASLSPSAASAAVSLLYRGDMKRQHEHVVGLLAAANGTAHPAPMASSHASGSTAAPAAPSAAAQVHAGVAASLGAAMGLGAAPKPAPAAPAPAARATPVPNQAAAATAPPAAAAMPAPAHVPEPSVPLPPAMQLAVTAVPHDRAPTPPPVSPPVAEAPPAATAQCGSPEAPAVVALPTASASDSGDVDMGEARAVTAVVTTKPGAPPTSDVDGATATARATGGATLVTPEKPHAPAQLHTPDALDCTIEQGAAPEQQQPYASTVLTTAPKAAAPARAVLIEEDDIDSPLPAARPTSNIDAAFEALATAASKLAGAAWGSGGAAAAKTGGRASASDGHVAGSTSADRSHAVAMMLVDMDDADLEGLEDI